MEIVRKKCRKFLISIIMVMIVRMAEICECCVDNERSGLLQIKSIYFDPNSPDFLSSWGTSDLDCCQWDRVECNSTTGHVTSLDLSSMTESKPGQNLYMNASMLLPFKHLNELYLQENNIAGCTHNEGFERLSTLTDLEILDLHSNNFNSTILRSINSLRSLKYLDLSANQLMGTINIADLSSTLQELDFRWNEIEGFETMPGLEIRLSTLTRLEILSLSSNKFNNGILRSLRGLSSLKSLELSFNKLHGKVNISELNDVTSTLQVLYLNDNDIEGFEDTQVKFNKLKYVDLSNNSFRGTFDFKALDGLINLQELDLSNNQITNFLVSKDFNKLEILGLSYNRINQTANSLGSIGRMISLNTLLLQNCGLSGNIASSQGLCHLKHLRKLDMSYNDLNGNLPQCFSNLTSLESLDLSHNRLNGKLLSSPIRSLESLQSLDLSHNLLQIPISLAPLFNLSQLVDLCADNNTIYTDTEDHNSNPTFQLEQLSLQGYGKGGRLPKFLYHQNSLISVNILSIKMRGEFPYWLLENNTRLSILFLTNTSLSGPLRLPIHPHVSLSYFDISDNLLSGYIPSYFGVFFPSLTLLFMARNDLKGGIPKSLCNITSLSFLDISQNGISGAIPRCFRDISQLILLDLSNNNIYGRLPSNFSTPFLKVVDLSKNRLQGSLKDAFCSSSNLFQLDLGHNNLSGSIPSCIGNLSELSFLVLGYNDFQGEIPIELCNLTQLSFIDLSHNSINGHMISCLNFSSYWSRKQSIIGKIELIADIEITMKGQAYMYEEKLLSYVSGIDVSSNYLNGRIPIKLGDLQSIKVLNLSHNTLRGTIPETFSNLIEIESLDLSHNNLQGTIPPQLTQLSSLIVFNVSYNNLSGMTPNQVGQFATFDESSYKGNPFLCGWPVSVSCTSNSPSSNETSSQYELSNEMFIDMEDFYVSFVIAYAMALLTLVAILCINPYWRRVWFYYVHMSIEKTCNFVEDHVIPLFLKF